MRPRVSQGKMCRKCALFAVIAMLFALAGVASASSTEGISSGSKAAASLQASRALLAEDVDPAAAAAAKKKRPEKASMVNKVVSFAPEANVTFGDDIDDDGGAGQLCHACCPLWTPPACSG